MITFAKEPRPDQVNESGQITDTALLAKNRTRFGLAGGAMATGGGFPVVTRIVQLFGGGDVHLGLLMSGLQVGSFFQFVGTLLLKRFCSNRKAMLSIFMVTLPGVVLGTLSILSIPMPSIRQYGLYAYLALNAIGGVCLGVMGNVESNWVGDMVPKNRFGWFTSFKWIAFNLVAFSTSLILSNVADHFPTAAGFAAVNLVSFAAQAGSALLYLSVSDREPRNLNFISAGASRHERIDYRNAVLWCYIAFYTLWAVGRSCLVTFYTVFLLEEFHFSLTKLAWLNGLQLVVSSVMLYLLGRLTDVKGNRLITVVISGVVALCMMLYVSSAWFGIVPIIVYTIINGAAGMTHSMLGTNLALETFPDKGRSAYLAFSRIVIGTAAVAAPALAGWLLHLFHDVRVEVWGAVLNRYHLIFFLGSLIAFSCVVPLVMMGKRTVRENNGTV